jgi:hypothetical protein
MAFPQTVQDIKTEIYVNSTWTDITSKVRSDPGITITRGRTDESSNVSPSTCQLALNNTDGRFSPRNPNSIYYGQIGRNTPIRVSILSDKSWLLLDSNTGTASDEYASTPDVAALDILTDIDLRFDADLDSWYDTMELVSKWTSTGNQRSYALVVGTGGYLRLLTSAAGTGTTTSSIATVPLPVLYGRQAVRAVFDADNGASGNTTTFYTSDSISGTWTQLGATVTNSGTATIFSSSSLVYVGPRSSGGAFSTATRGRIFAAQVYNSAGTLVANPDFSIQTEGATSFADSTSKTWTLNGSTLTKRDYRFRGEVSAWPQKWDQSGSDVYADIECAGILRRLGQGQAPVPSSIYRTISSDTDVVAYWPAEDNADADRLGSAFPNGRAMSIAGTPTLANNDDWEASKSLPTLNFASFVGAVNNYTATDSAEVRMYLSIPAAGIANGIIIATVSTTGSVRRWDLVYGTGGTLSLAGYDDDGVLLITNGPTAFLMNGSPRYVAMRMADSGTSIDLDVLTVDPGNGISLSSVNDLLASNNVGRVTKIVINPEKRMDDVVMGHFSVHKSSAYVTATTVSTVLAWEGETAGQRIKRLCTENSIPFFQLSSIDNTSLMGKQDQKTALELLREAAETDLGILYEPRDQYGLTYRPRLTLNNQLATFTAAYSTNQLTSFEPVEDDDTIRNDVTVTRIGGGSTRVTDTTSILSVNSPPLGVGIYDTSVLLSLYTDGQLDDQAGWRLHLGTIDEARFPVIGFDLTSPSFLADSTLTFKLLQLDIGDRLVVTGSPAWLPPDDVQQIAQGFSEYLSNFERRISVNCTPASVWYVGRYSAATSSGSNQSKYSTVSTTNATMTTTATSMSVATNTALGYALWTTVAAQMPIDLMVGGERMTATAISGTTSPQAFTVTRSVNGIVKTHAVGESVKLFRPAVYQLA